MDYQVIQQQPLQTNDNKVSSDVQECHGKEEEEEDRLNGVGR